jgi:small multidrug resistance pump
VFTPFALLFAAIGMEVSASAALPRTRGFHDLPWSLAVLGGYGISIWLLALVVRQIPVSITYAVWSGVGTAAIAIFGVVVLGERIDPLKILALTMIIGGVVVLNLHTAH